MRQYLAQSNGKFSRADYSKYAHDHALPSTSVVEKKYGVKPILYTSYKFKKDYLNEPVFNEYPYWIAHYYINKLEYKGKWVMWQHTDCGKVDGIKGFVDCNIFNGTIQDLDAFTIKENDIDLSEENIEEG